MSQPKLKVLISNDDGPPNEQESPFVLPFIDHLEQLGWDVKACLPDSQKSWIAKSFMIKDHIQMSYYHRQSREISFHQKDPSDFVLLSGTPATCINIALHHLFKDTDFDLIITGPNLGRNSSTIYTLASGTIGSALEATVCSKKAIALSFPFYNRNYTNDDILNACRQATDVILQLWKKNNWPQGGLFNINVPLTNDKAMPVKLTKFHQASYGSLFKPIARPIETSDNVEQQVRLDAEGANNPSFRFAPDIKAITQSKDAPPGTDAHAIDQRWISVTPMMASYEMASLDEDYGIHPRL
ncbi:sure-like protein [Hesseltinella vesiculosa]|uniref:Sure-like protein n=1 Tax=Hesseltinella vesiculosa TaxID=101127 RepID=A0A1X2GHG7_9FUNG|nr:sure-like protein [Hesseltinella vesiculosa]